MSVLVVSVLEGARELVRAGWVQGISIRTDSKGQACYCASAAIAKFAGANLLAYLWACTRFRDANYTAGVVHFNDATGRTLEEMIVAFDAAIELAKLKGDPDPA